VDSARALARARNDPDLERVATVRHARLLIPRRQAAAADSEARSVLPAAQAARDTATWCAALRILCFLENRRHDFAAGARDARALVDLAHRAGRTSDEGWGWLGLAYIDIESGRMRESIDKYRRSRTVCHRARDARGELYAAAGVARGLQILGDADGARREHMVVLDGASRLRDAYQLSETYTNLGALEHSYGDPAQALFYYERAESVSRAMGFTERVVYVERNLALLYLTQHRVDAADSVLRRLLPVVERSRDPELRARVLAQTGVLRRLQGRNEAAVEFGRRAVALADSIPPITAVDMIKDLATTLSESGRTQEALEVVDGQIRKLGPRIDPELREGLSFWRAELLLELGRPADAIALIVNLPTRGATTGVIGYDQVQHRIVLARCYQAVGRPDSAIAVYRGAAALWEKARSAMSEAEWREHYDDAASQFAGAYATLLLDPARGGTADARAREAFAVLQGFRSRTLLERVLGPKAAATPAFTSIEAAVVQRQVLREGELFIDIHAGPDTTVVFLLTRSELRAYFAPSSSSLTPRLRRLRALLGDPSAGARDVVTGAERSLGAELLRPASDALSKARSILLASGALAQYPLAALVPPGGSGGLGEQWEVAQVPSAALLSVCRSGTKRAEGSVPLFALARTRDESGNVIAGAAKEVRTLSQRYQGAVARVDPPMSASQISSNDLVHSSVLHFASHARTEFAQPWRSGLLLGDPTRPDAYLRADAIARLRLPARLCVMSSCRSIGGRDRSGETLEGLAASWLAAGVPAVVATQWEGDDQALVEIMRRFYERLARGEAAGAALRGAQSELRALPAYALPYYWQGVVLLGDPGTLVHLKRRGERSPG
jgi:CHAT domain-containing protein/tetratricopeptide (TPR) repeat protein